MCGGGCAYILNSSSLGRTQQDCEFGTDQFTWKVPAQPEPYSETCLKVFLRENKTD